MREIKLTGRERCVLRALDFVHGSTGEQLLEHTGLEGDDLVDIINALLEVGFMEMDPYGEQTSAAAFQTDRFEVNASYASDLRTAMLRAY